MSRTYAHSPKHKQPHTARKMVRYICHSEWYEWSVQGKQQERKKQLVLDLKQALLDYQESKTA